MLACVTLIAVAGAAIAVANAGGQAWAESFTGPAALIASPAASGAAQPNLVADPKGRVWLSWLEPKAGGGHRFRAAHYSGSAWSTPITIVEGANLLANWADFPSLFVGADGTIAAHWLERTTGREAYFVRIKLSTDDGKTWGQTLTPHKDASATEHGFVSFFDAPGGGIGLVWLDGREMAGGHGPGHAGAMTLRSTVIRKGVAGDESVVDARVCDCCQTSAARIGNAVLVAYRDRTDKEIRDTSVARFANGEWSAPVSVHNDGWEITGCPVNGPAVAAAGTGAAVAWFTSAGGGPRVLVAFSPDLGHTFEPPVRVDAAATLGRVGIVMPAPNRALVISLERAQTGARLVLRDVRREGRMGISDPIVIADATPDRSGGFARLALSGRKLLVAWTDVKAGAPSRIQLASLELRQP